MLAFLVGLALLLLCWPAVPASPSGQAGLPDSLTDRAFWELVESLSEADGVFEHGALQFSDNLVSNEYLLHRLAPLLPREPALGRVYVGVGPEQNFTYVAALAPPMAFVVDIRRQNRDLHLFYKAVFELAESRAAFLERLFSRRLGDRPSPGTSVGELFDALAASPPQRTLFEANRAAVASQLTKTRAIPLSVDERRNIAGIHEAFFTHGPAIHYWSGTSNDTASPTYAEMMTAADRAGTIWSFLGSEDRYERVRSLHLRNLIVPLIGDFAGLHALRRLGVWLRDRGARTGVFYASNVEGFLVLQKRWSPFCRNLVALPQDGRSVLVRYPRLRPSSIGGFDPRPDENGRHAVTYFDGRVARVSRRELLELEPPEIQSLQDVTTACR